MAAASVVNSVKQIYAGLGSPSDYQSIHVAAGGTATTTLTTAVSGINKGRWRAKFSAPGGSTTVALVVTVDDGTTTYTVFSQAASAAMSSTSLLDYSGEFLVDINVVNVNFVVTMGTSTAVTDLEVALGN